jgi:hypothetical protein
MDGKHLWHYLNLMKHHNHSPSSFPMRLRCARFESGPAGAAAEHGTAMHSVFASLFEDRLPLFDSSISEDDLESLKWAKEQVDTLSLSEHPLEIETRLTYSDAKLKEVYFGTGDVVNGPQLFDLKTGEQHGYWPQMAGYALALMDEKGYKSVDTHLLYTRYRKVYTRTIEKKQAEAVINDIIVRAEDPGAPETPNEYCGWCSRRLECTALRDRANAIVADQDWTLESYRIEDISKNSDELSKAVNLSRLMKKWVAAVEDEMKNHEEIPGYKWREVKGRRSIKDALAASKRSDLPIEAFLRACSTSVTALEKAYREELGITPREARELIEVKLSEVIHETKPYKKLEQK